MIIECTRLVHSRVTIHANRNIRHICHIIVATQGTNEWMGWSFMAVGFTAPVDKYICPHVFGIFFGSIMRAKKWVIIKLHSFLIWGCVCGSNGYCEVIKTH